jgi:hypothetical protein
MVPTYATMTCCSSFDMARLQTCTHCRSEYSVTPTLRSIQRPVGPRQARHLLPWRSPSNGPRRQGPHTIRTCLGAQPLDQHLEPHRRSRHPRVEQSFHAHLVPRRCIHVDGDYRRSLLPLEARGFGSYEDAETFCTRRVSRTRGCPRSGSTTCGIMPGPA